jgi:hypothetical protein
VCEYCVLCVGILSSLHHARYVPVISGVCVCVCLCGCVCVVCCVSACVQPRVCTYIHINWPWRIGERVLCLLRDADGRGQESVRMAPSESDDEDGKEGGEARDPRTREPVWADERGPGTPTTGTKGNRGGGGVGGGAGIAGLDMAERGGKRKPAPGKDYGATPAKKCKVYALASMYEQQWIELCETSDEIKEGGQIEYQKKIGEKKIGVLKRKEDNTGKTTWVIECISEAHPHRGKEYQDPFAFAIDGEDLSYTKKDGTFFKDERRNFAVTKLSDVQDKTAQRIATEKKRSIRYRVDPQDKDTQTLQDLRSKCSKNSPTKTMPVDGSIASFSTQQPPAAAGVDLRASDGSERADSKPQAASAPGLGGAAGGTGGGGGGSGTGSQCGGGRCGGSRGESEESASDEDIFEPRPSTSAGTGVEGANGVKKPPTQSLPQIPCTQRSLQLELYRLLMFTTAFMCVCSKCGYNVAVHVYMLSNMTNWAFLQSEFPDNVLNTSPHSFTPSGARTSWMRTVTWP